MSSSRGKSSSSLTSSSSGSLTSSSSTSTSTPAATSSSSSSHHHHHHHDKNNAAPSGSSATKSSSRLVDAAPVIEDAADDGSDSPPPSTSPTPTPLSSATSSTSSSSLSSLSSSSISITTTPSLSASAPPGAAAAAAAAEQSGVKWDWHSYESKFEAQTDPLLMFPPTSVSVAEIPRQVRTAVSPRLPPGVSIENANTAAIAESLKLFTKSWTYVQQISAEAPPPTKTEELPNLDYEQDWPKQAPEKMSSDPSVSMEPSLLRDPISLLELPSEGPRQKLFHIYPMSKMPIYPSYEHSGTPQFSQRGMRISVECKQLKLDHNPAGAPEFEPFFVNLCLFDMLKKEKISENFSCDFPAQGAKPTPDILRIKTAIFHVDKQPTPPIHVYLVVEVLKVLRGDYDEATEPYCKAMAPKEVPKFVTSTADTLKNLAPWRQVFAWGAVALDPTKAELQIPLVRCNSDLAGLLPKLGIEKEAKRLKVIPGHLLVGLTVNPEITLANPCLDPTFLPLAPFPNATSDLQCAHTREVLDFPQHEYSALPHLDYYNLLYFTPDSLNFTNYKGESSGRNICITVKLCDTDTVPDPDGLPVIYGDSSSPSMVTKSCVTVVYHNKRPKYSLFDEIKIQLPLKLTPQHHLLVTFSHINCKVSKKKSSEAIETPLGHCVIPLVSSSGEFLKLEPKSQRPVIQHPLVNGYLTAMNEPVNPHSATPPQIKWIDTGKAVFTYKLTLVSSVIPKDPALSRLFQLTIPKSASIDISFTKMDESIVGSVVGANANSETDLHVLQALAHVPENEKVKFFPLIVRKLLQLMRHSNTTLAYESFKQLVGTIESVKSDLLRQENPDPVLETYIDYMYDLDSSEPPNHEILVKYWTQALNDPTEQVKSCTYSWFLFALIFKDMTLFLNNKNVLDSNEIARSNRLNPEFEPDLREFLRSVGFCLNVFKKTQLALARSLNKDASFFLERLFSIIDRGWIFSMVQTYIYSLNAGVPELAELKWVSLRIICHTEHFIPLNLPEDTTLNTVSDIRETFFHKHFLVGLVIYELQLAFKASPEYIRLQAIELLRDLLFKHDHDARYQKPEQRRKIALIYFPYVLFVLENFMENYVEGNKVIAFKKNDARLLMICLLYILKDLDMAILSQWWKKENMRKVNKLFKILLLCVDLFSYPGKAKSLEFVEKAAPVKEETPVLKDSTSTLALSANMSSSSISGLPPPPSSAAPVPAHKDGLRNFSRARKESAHLTGFSPDEAKMAIEQRYSGTSRGHGDTRKKFVATEIVQTQPTLSYTPETISPLWQHLSHECNHICLKVLLRYLTDISTNLDNSDESAMSTFYTVFEVLVALFSKSSSQELLSFMIIVVHSLIVIYKPAIFRARNMICGNLTRKLLDHCNSQNVKMRIKAASLLHNMIMENFNEVGNISRMKLQCIIGISQMVGDSGQDFERLQNTLTTIEAAFKAKQTVFSAQQQKKFYNAHVARIMQEREDQVIKERLGKYKAELQKTKTGGFKTGNQAELEARKKIHEEVIAMVEKEAKDKVVKDGASPLPMLNAEMAQLKTRLFGIIADSLKMRECAFDPEMTSELYYKLSVGFQDSPDLRVTWLNTLAKQHQELGNKEEYAQTKVLTAALAAAYLYKLGKFPVELSNRDITRVFPMWTQENSLPPIDMLNSVKEDICLGSEFTLDGWEQLLHDAVSTLGEAKLYEQSVETYQLLLEVYRHFKDFVKQSMVYKKLHTICDQVIEDCGNTSRVMPNYYRVAFYGEAFGPELHGKEFVYKESCFVRLPEVSKRLIAQYTTESRSIEFIPNTKEVVMSELDKSKCYIQLAALAPYWPSEKKVKMPLLEQHFNLSQFLMEMPFTEGGKAHSPHLDEQWKKKVIYTVKGSFPYVLKRLPIVSREEQKIPPILNSLEAIQDKSSALKREYESKYPNAKTLQINLNGSLLAFVNAGPLEIAKVFLNKEGSAPKGSQEHVEMLEKEMLEFTKNLQQALNLNESLISQDQRPLQEELKKAFTIFEETVNSLVTTSRAIREQPPAAATDAPTDTPSSAQTSTATSTAADSSS
ncbi:DOCK family protein [Pelomyxa schiedti]|nr:DOCK family protein [Pelomyxa schiedti]